MDLKFCPSCGQSVLDDEARECPFCGAAMDGSSGGSRKPKGGSSAGSRAGVAKPGRPKSPAGDASPPESQSKPVPTGMKPIKPRTDEDDPFGLGAVSSTANALQARPKPAKGCLHRVICPMCEKPGFIPKSAIGKQVRCANEKCMVPVFIAPDPNAPVTDKTPRRRAPVDTDLESEKTLAKKPASPMMMYGIVGVVVLALGGGVAWYLNQPPAAPADLNNPINIQIGEYAPDPAEVEAAKQAEQKKQAEAAAAVSPTREAERLAKRMIQAARQPSNRDKAYARRLSGDVYLRTGNTTAASQEFSQLLSVNRQAGYYEIDPFVQAFWRNRARGDATAAAKNLQVITRELSSIPARGRLGIESALAAASVLMVEGKSSEAAELVQKMQRDATVALNRDAMASAAWFFTANTLRSNDQNAIAVTDVFAWNNPLRTAVAVDLAARGQIRQAIEWSVAGTDAREVGDSMAAVAELACLSSASAEAMQQINTAVSTLNPMTVLRIKAIIAASTKQPELLAECTAGFGQVSTDIVPLQIPSIAETIRLNIKSGDSERLTAAALTEYVIAAVACDNQTLAEQGVRQLLAVMNQIVPPTVETRKAVQEVEKNESEVKRRIQSEMRIASDSQITSTFRNYRRKLDQLADTAEERRLTLILRLARIVRNGGIPAIQAVFDDASSGLRQEVMLDELSGMLAAAASRVGTSFSATENTDPALQVPLPKRTDALHEIRVGPLLVKASQLAKNNRLPNAIRLLETGSIDLPGLREAVLNELIYQSANKAENPSDVYSAIGLLGNSVWREEALQTAGYIFVKRGMEKQAEAWLEAENRMPPTEQVAGFYALAVGLIDRAAAEEKTTE